MKLNPKKAFIRIYPEQYSIFGELGHDRLAVAGPANYGVSFLKLLEAALEELNLGGGSTVTTNTINYNNGTLTSSVNGVSDTTVITLSSPTVAGLMSSQQFSDLIDVLVDVTNLQTLTGIPDGDTDLGTFTGSVISDNVSIKQALQELENALGGPTASDLSNGTQTATEAPILNSNGDGVSLPLATNTLAGLASAAHIAAIEKSIGDITDLLSILGVADGDTTPTYTSTNIVDANDNIEEAISKLDAARKEKIEIPNTAFNDVTTPTIAEVRTWIDANLTDLQKVNSQLFMIEGTESAENPIHSWDIIQDNLTLSNPNNWRELANGSKSNSISERIYREGPITIDDNDPPFNDDDYNIYTVGRTPRGLMGGSNVSSNSRALSFVDFTTVNRTFYFQKAGGSGTAMYVLNSVGDPAALIETQKSVSGDISATLELGSGLTTNEADGDRHTMIAFNVGNTANGAANSKEGLIGIRKINAATNNSSIDFYAGGVGNLGDNTVLQLEGNRDSEPAVVVPFGIWLDQFGQGNRDLGVKTDSDYILGITTDGKIFEKQVQGTVTKTNVTLSLTTERRVFAKPEFSDIDVTLPDASTLDDGIVVQVSAYENGTNNVDILPFGTDQINGVNAAIVAGLYETLEFTTIDNNWIRTK